MCQEYRLKERELLCQIKWPHLIFLVADSLECLLQVRQQMCHNKKWKEQFQILEDRALSADNVIAVLAPRSGILTQFKPSSTGKGLSADNVIRVLAPTSGI